MNQDGFCGNCGSPRVQGQSECPQCGSSYGATYAGPQVSLPGQTAYTLTKPPIHTPTVLAAENTPSGNTSPTRHDAGTFPGNDPSSQYSGPMQQIVPTLVSPPPGAYPSGVMPMQPAGKKSSLTRNIIIGQTALNIILLVLVGVLIARPSSPGNTPGTANNPTATTAPVTGGNPTQQPTNTPTATVAAKSTATSGTSTKNLMLTCGAACNDPVLVTIKTITINSSLVRMIWDISFQNNTTGTNLSVFLGDFTLQDSLGQKYPGQPEKAVFGLSPNQVMDEQITFSFVPLAGENYTFPFTVTGQYNGVASNPFSVTFEPVTFTF